MSSSFVEKIVKSCPFEVDIYCEGYPDVIYEIILDDQPTQEQIETVVTALEDFVYGYNKTHILRPIHDVSEISGIPGINYHPRGIYVHIDFGLCSLKAPFLAVKALQETDLPIFRVALR